MVTTPSIAWREESAIRGPVTMSDPDLEEAVALMDGFAARDSRYLWTGAFAVCNDLGLARRTGDERFKRRALRLIERVHHTLGRHRGDDPRSGCISGLDERAGGQHPTRGGLRIGKALPEREPGAPLDERREWDRDGQYFHYLTKWMHALDQAARATREPRFNLWARELAQTAVSAFSVAPARGQPRQMVWKMSIDLSRTLVPSMGQHDPLDGWVTMRALRATAAGLPEALPQPTLNGATRALAAMLDGRQWATPDPLGIGGLLFDACRLSQLDTVQASSNARVVEDLLYAALSGLEHYAQSSGLRSAADYRFAFRELGLAIGLHGIKHLHDGMSGGRITLRPESRASFEALMACVPLGEAITSFWLDPVNRRAATRSEHRDINEVMLATALAPDGMLMLRHPGR